MDESMETVLQVAACFGQTIKTDILKAVLPDVQLDDARDLLVPKGDFVHEAAQKDIYNMIDRANRRTGELSSHDWSQDLAEIARDQAEEECHHRYSPIVVGTAFC